MVNPKQGMSRILFKSAETIPMKKITAILFLLAIMVAGYSQTGDLKKQTYLRVGYSLPGWKYNGYNNKTDWPDNVKRVGGIIETGNIFMLNSIKLAPGMRLGINVDYLSVTFNRFFDAEVSGNSENFLFIGSKIGPSFSYCPVQRLTFDAYVKFNPVWVAGSFTASSVEFIDDQAWLGFMGIKYSAGINIRFLMLMVGMEINPGFVKMRRYNEEEKKLEKDDYFGNNEDNSNKTPVPSLNFTVGFSF